MERRQGQVHLQRHTGTRGAPVARAVATAAAAVASSASPRCSRGGVAALLARRRGSIFVFLLRLRVGRVGVGRVRPCGVRACASAASAVEVVLLLLLVLVDVRVCCVPLAAGSEHHLLAQLVRIGVDLQLVPCVLATQDRTALQESLQLARGSLGHEERATGAARTCRACPCAGHEAARGGCRARVELRVHGYASKILALAGAIVHRQLVPTVPAAGLARPSSGGRV